MKDILIYGLIMTIVPVYLLNKVWRSDNISAKLKKIFMILLFIGIIISVYVTIMLIT